MSQAALRALSDQVRTHVCARAQDLHAHARVATTQDRVLCRAGECEHGSRGGGGDAGAGRGETCKRGGGGSAGERSTRDGRGGEARGGSNLDESRGKARCRKRRLDRSPHPQPSPPALTPPPPPPIPHPGAASAASAAATAVGSAVGTTLVSATVAGAAMGVSSGASLVKQGARLARGAGEALHTAGEALHRLMADELTHEQLSALDAARRTLDPCADPSADPQQGARVRTAFNEGVHVHVHGGGISQSAQDAPRSLHAVLAAGRSPTAEEWSGVRVSCPELAECTDAALNNALQLLSRIRVDERTLFSRVQASGYRHQGTGIGVDERTLFSRAQREAPEHVVVDGWIRRSSPGQGQVKPSRGEATQVEEEEEHDVTQEHLVVDGWIQQSKHTQ